MLTLQIIKAYFEQFKEKALDHAKKGNKDYALAYINASAYISYSLCLSYKDDEIESLIKELSFSITKRAFIIKRVNSVVFFDMFSKDHSGLTLQYINALIANQYEILYMYENDLSSSLSSILKATLRKYDKVSLCRVPSKMSNFQKSQWIYDRICEYGSDKLIMHLFPQSAIECTAFYALPLEITRYQINLTDHSFWLGKGCSDYLFEFRQFGCAVSVRERGFTNDKLLLLPYYPVMDAVPFQGFPLPEGNNKVIFFSGGNYYKVLGKNHYFFTLCKKILENCENAIILFAGIGDDTSVVNLLDQLGISDRFLLLGFRHDIIEVFRHSDIYINTYPIDGGLMCQFAAHCSLPILNYLNDRSEELVCQKSKVSFTSSTEQDFLNEAIRLYRDHAYRKERGRKIKETVISKEEFNVFFNDSIHKNHTSLKIDVSDVNLDIKYDTLGKLEYFNRTKSFQRLIVRLVGIRGVLDFPSLYVSAFINSLTQISKKVWKKIL